MSTGLRSTSLVVGVLIAITTPVVLRAQTRLPSGVAATASSGDTARMAITEEPLRARSDVARAAVTASGAPRSFQVVRIGVPVEMPGNLAVSYDVVSEGVVNIVGARQGEIPAGASRDRAVLLTLGIPARSLAGRAVVARVRFAAAGVSGIDVPVELEVTPVHHVLLEPVEQLRAAQPGDLFTLRVRVTNLGNVDDTIRVQAVPPDYWRNTAPAQSAAIPLEVNASATVALKVRIPEFVGSGSSSISIVALLAGAELARAPASVEVLERGRQDYAGPVLTTGVAATDAQGAAGSASLELDGKVGANVEVHGRLLPQQSLNDGDQRALARVGYASAPSYLRLQTPNNELDLGPVSGSLSDLAGSQLWGTGAWVSHDAGTWNIAGIAASSYAGIAGGNGGLFGARIGTSFDSTKVFGAASHLDRGDGLTRLDAVSMGVSRPLIGIGTFTEQLGYRSFENGNGVGAFSSFDRSDPAGVVHASVMHAPGGNGAFARATDEMQLSASRALSNRVMLGGAAFRTHDMNANFSRLDGSGVSLFPTLALTQHTSIGIEARSNVFHADGDFGTFGNGEKSIGLDASTFRGMYYATTSVNGGSISRDVALPGSSRLSASAPHEQWRGVFGVISDRGLFDVSTDLQATGPGVGWPARQSMVAIRGDHVPVAINEFLRRRLFVTGEIDRFGMFGEPLQYTLVRTALTLALPRDYQVTFDAEHNGIYRPTGGGWNTVLRVEHATHLPFLGSSEASGRVFQDLNANGRRDAGEPGFPGVVMRLGSETAVSDDDGRFRFHSDAQGDPTLDARSLPNGWLVSTVSGARGNHSHTVGLVPTVPVEIRLEPAPDSGGRMPVVNLASASVTLRDSSGRTWVAPSSKAGVARFDAVPANRYTIELDLSAVGEPLHTRGEIPALVVGRENPSTTVTIPVYGRPLRFFRKQSADSVAPAGPSAGMSADASIPEVRTPQRPLLASNIAPHVAADAAPARMFDASSSQLQGVGRVFPASSTIAEPFYVVRPRDTLRRIAATFLLSEMRWPALFDLNRAIIHDPNLIFPGQRMRVITLAAPDPQDGVSLKRGASQLP